MKFSNSRCPAIITVFHLPRFYNKLESVSSLNTRVIFACLNQSETKSIPVEAVVSKYGKHTLRNLTSQFSVLLETAVCCICIDFIFGIKGTFLLSQRVVRLTFSFHWRFPVGSRSSC